jgi:hypothetical protein
MLGLEIGYWTYCANLSVVSVYRSFGHGFNGLDTDKKDI